MNIQETLQQKLGKEIAQASNEEIYGALLSMVQEMAGEKERTDSKKKLREKQGDASDPQRERSKS